MAEIICQRRVFGFLFVVSDAFDEGLDVGEAGRDVFGGARSGLQFLAVIESVPELAGDMGRQRIGEALAVRFEQGMERGEGAGGGGLDAVEIRRGEAVVQGQIGARGMFGEAGGAGIADAAGRDVDDAEESFIVARVGEDAQIGHEVADFLAVVELHAADDHIGNTITAQDFFEGAGVGVHAQENGAITE